RPRSQAECESLRRRPPRLAPVLLPPATGSPDCCAVRACPNPGLWPFRARQSHPAICPAPDTPYPIRATSEHDRAPPRWLASTLPPLRHAVRSVVEPPPVSAIRWRTEGRAAPPPDTAADLWPVARWLALDEVVGGRRVHHILGPPFRLVALRATGSAYVFPRGHQPIEGGTVALAARCVVMARSLCPARHVVRVVAGGAVQRALAFEETFGPAYPVNGVHELELVIVTSARRVIEE